MLSELLLDADVYDGSCKDCARLSSFLLEVKTKHPDYFCAPVPPFGSQQAELLVIGLAPGMHGANASGRPFTGDWCSDLLYGTLHAYGFASERRSVCRGDGLQLINCRLTNAVKCLPPENKPMPAEVKACSRFLKAEIAAVKPRVVVCLGAVAHNAFLRSLDLAALGLKASAFRFGHAVQHQIAAMTLIDSYHPSRYNTNTGRLTEPMFHAVFKEARRLIDRVTE